MIFLILCHHWAKMWTFCTVYELMWEIVSVWEDREGCVSNHCLLYFSNNKSVSWNSTEIPGCLWNKKLFFTSLLSSLGYFWDYYQSVNVSFPQIVAFIRVLDLIIHPDLNSKHHYKPPNSSERWAWVPRLCFKVLHIKRGKGVCVCVWGYRGGGGCEGSDATVIPSCGRWGRSWCVITWENKERCKVVQGLMIKISLLTGLIILKRPMLDPFSDLSNGVWLIIQIKRHHKRGSF